MFPNAQALSDRKELLGSELRDIFDAHPAAPSRDRDARAELAAAKLDMTIFTEGANSRRVCMCRGRCVGWGWALYDRYRPKANRT